MATCSVPTEIVRLLTPNLVGSELNWGLYGVLTVQIYIYHVTPFRDSVFVTTAVYMAFLIETAQTIMMSYDSHHILISSWGCAESAYRIYTTYMSLVVFPSLAGGITQSFYAWRLYIISQSLIQSILVIVLVMLQVGAALASGIGYSRLSSDYNSTSSSNILIPTTIWAVTSGICDVFIAASMTYHLSRKRTGFKKTDKLIDGLIRMVVETGCASAIVALVGIGLYVGFSKYHYYVTPALVVSKVYSNSLMVILNSRKPKTSDGSRGSASTMTWPASHGRAEPSNTEDSTDRADTSLTGGENERIIMVDLRASQAEKGEKLPATCDGASATEG